MPLVTVPTAEVTVAVTVEVVADDGVATRVFDLDDRLNRECGAARDGCRRLSDDGQL